MKKFFLSFVFLALLLSSCRANQPANPSQPNPSSREVTSVSVTSDNVESSTAIIWVEDIYEQTTDESGLRWEGVIYKEVDLSKPRNGYIWNEVGRVIETRGELTQTLGHRIETRDEAARIANEILASEQGAGLFTKYVLSHIDQDPNKKIWIFVYGENRVNALGSNFLVAMDGESGELIRTWIM